MRKKDYPPTFLAHLKKMGWDLDLYCAIFDKCLSPQELTNKKGDEYKIGSDLHSIGWMSMKFTPKWLRGRYYGNTVEFETHIHL